jgi:hypothetical protein
MEKSERMKKVIVNLATHIDRYKFGQNRLIQSYFTYANQGSENDDVVPLITFLGESMVGSPPHEQNPYAFKVYSIEKMRDEGYEQVLWLDSSIVFVKNVKPIFDWIGEKGFFFEEAGHWAGSWCNDRTLEYFKITREDAMTMPMFSAGFLGLDFTNPIAIEFFERWKESMWDMQFIGEWSNHRHDMTCASIIANQMGMNKQYSSGGNFFAYIGGGYTQPKESVICHLIGL